ncbi:MAG: hypothetical protein HOV68_09835 [Streptomycetaceae bacterium]|nr:hypothetical protein [Streptomycetaceae bacterium]
MTATPCPFHNIDDNCQSLLDMLAQAGVIAVSPTAPATAEQVRSDPGAGDLPRVPLEAVSVRAAAMRVNDWSPHLDPTIPMLDPAAPDSARSVRFGIRALTEAPPLADLSAWLVRNALFEAHLATERTVGSPAEAAAQLWWYVAVLHLDHARALWDQQRR